MADAIPVHSGKKVNVQPATDKNGVPVAGDYAAKVRENLGDPSDFAQGEGREMVTYLDRPNGTQYEHKYTREDH